MLRTSRDETGACAFGAQGQVLEANRAASSDPPPSFKRTITLTEENGVTTLTLFAEFEDIDRRERVRMRGFVAGTLESYDRLEQHLEALA